MNLIDYIVLAIVAICAVAAIYYIKIHGSCSCGGKGCSCSGAKNGTGSCSSCSSCASCQRCQKMKNNDKMQD